MFGFKKKNAAEESKRSKKDLKKEDKKDLQLNKPISLKEMENDFMPVDIEVEPDGEVGEQVVFAGIALGDIAGSVYDEGDEHSLPDGDLWDDEMLTYTGNTVLADAIIFGAERLMMDNMSERKKMRILYTNVLKQAYKNHPDVEYEADFDRWARNEMQQDEARLYQSNEPQGAIRAMPIGAMFEDVKDVIHHAITSALPTHGNPDGLRGAMTLAVCVWLASHGATKPDILKYAMDKYPKQMSTTFLSLQMGKGMKPSSACSYVVPAAIICFLNSQNYEDCIRNAMSIEGDSCAICSAAGGLAAAFYQETVENEDEIMERYVPEL